MNLLSFLAGSSPGRGRNRKRFACLLLLSGFLLGGCASSSKPLPEASPSPAASAAPRVLGTAAKGNALADKLRTSLAGLNSLARGLEQNCFSVYGWTIPVDLLAQCADDVATHHVSEEEGFFVCTASRASFAHYTATGMDAGLPGRALSTRTPEEAREDEEGAGDMNTDLMGDFSVSGGGDFLRTVLMRFSPDASFGTVDSALTLNGEQSGKENFVFLFRDGTLYFYDAALNVTAFDEDGNALGEATWLISRGFLAPAGADVVEYVSREPDLPDPASLPGADLNAAAALQGAQRLKVLDGRGQVTREGAVLEEFALR